eukprot:2895677-Amphidinium_carterae.2
MKSIPEEVTHDEMVSAVMSDLVEHKLLSIHGLVLNEDSSEKEMQKITSEVVLQDFYVDADGVDSEKLKKAMIKEMDNLTDSSSEAVEDHRHRHSGCMSQCIHVKPPKYFYSKSEDQSK